ncbi:MAG: AmmeMemoRadiSam system protein B [Bdellovibrionales bacterium]|nr:AmmeMemoRadiSam system protein B [Bdellovibrionales bacterium]
MKETPSHIQYPALREPIEIRVERHDGQAVLILHCPLGIKEQPLVLNPVIAPVLQRFDGKRSLETIQHELSGQGATTELILQVAQLLNDSLFLVGPTFEKAKADHIDAFKNATVREPFLAGLSYSGTSEELNNELNEYLLHGQAVSHLLHENPLRCLMTPHIDYRRGHECYGRAFSALENQQPDCILLIGTSHQYSPHLFHLTKKDFSSPLGVMHSDREIISAIANAYGEERAFTDEYLHKREHSLELQIPFLQKFCPQSQLIPILVGSFHPLIRDQRPRTRWEPYGSFVEILAEQLEQKIFSRGRSIMILAGVDMAHIGRFFGDTRELTEEWMESIRARDEEYLHHLQNQDADKLFTHIASDQDERRICGFPTMLTVLDLFDALGFRGKNELLDYRQAVSRDNGCAVTFAGMAFYDN